MTNEVYDAACIDIETYGLKRYSAVWAIALTLFNYDNSRVKTFTFIPSVRFQKDTLGMSVDRTFWDSIDSDGHKRAVIRHNMENNSVCFKYNKKNMQNLSNDMRSVIYGWIRDPEQACLYGNDITFDQNRLEELFDKMKIKYPWHYRSWVSIPTIIKLAKLKTGIDYKKVFKNKVRDATHDPILDTLDEIAYTQRALKAIGVI